MEGAEAGGQVAVHPVPARLGEHDRDAHAQQAGNPGQFALDEERQGGAVGHQAGGQDEPETTQAVYRVADSVTNCVTPMSPYSVMALGFIQQYRKSAGIGTLASFTIPVAAVLWVAFFVAWYLLVLPLGIN